MHPYRPVPTADVTDTPEHRADMASRLRAVPPGPPAPRPPRRVHAPLEIRQ